MTEAGYWAWIRSSLRRMSQRWRPIYGILSESRRAVTTEDRRRWGNRVKFVHQCSRCEQWFPRKQIEVDHIIPCGSLRCEADVGPFITRMLCERSGLRLLCEPCHQIITHQEK